MLRALSDIDHSRTTLGVSSADAPPDLGANAALKYWQAFSQLPKFTDAQENKLLAEYLTMPVDDQREKSWPVPITHCG